MTGFEYRDKTAAQFQAEAKNREKQFAARRDAKKGEILGQEAAPKALLEQIWPESATTLETNTRSDLHAYFCSVGCSFFDRDMIRYRWRLESCISVLASRLSVVGLMRPLCMLPEEGSNVLYLQCTVHLLIEGFEATPSLQGLIQSISRTEPLAPFPGDLFRTSWRSLQ